MKKFFRVLSLALLATSLFASNLSAQGNPSAVIRTNLGDIHLELLADKAPVSVDNFISYAKSGAYDGTIFHRVIPNFMIQGGGFTPDMEKKTTREPIPNEAGNGVLNDRGTVAMARTNQPHSATTQFFINTQDNPNLNYTGETDSRAWGYAVFGRVTEGMNVVDEIRMVETTRNQRYSDVPVEAVIIESVEISGG